MRSACRENGCFLLQVFYCYTTFKLIDKSAVKISETRPSPFEFTDLSPNEFAQIFSLILFEAKVTTSHIEQPASIIHAQYPQFNGLFRFAYVQTCHKRQSKELSCFVAAIAGLLLNSINNRIITPESI